METAFIFAGCVVSSLVGIVLFRRSPRLFFAVAVLLVFGSFAAALIWRGPLERDAMKRRVHPVTVVAGNEVDFGVGAFKRRLVLADANLPDEDDKVAKAKDELTARLKDKQVSIQLVDADDKRPGPWTAVVRLEGKSVNAAMVADGFLVGTGANAEPGEDVPPAPAPSLPGWMWCGAPVAVVLLLMLVKPPKLGRGRVVQKPLPADPVAAKREVLALIGTPEVAGWLKELAAQRRVISKATPLWVAVLEASCQDVSSGYFRPRRTASLFGGVPILGAFIPSVVIQDGEFPHTHSLSESRPRYAYPGEIRPRVHGSMEFLPLPAFLARSGFPLDTSAGVYPDPFLLDVHAVIVRGEDGEPKLGTFDVTHELILGEKGQTFALGTIENVSNVATLRQRPLAPATRQAFVDELAASGRGVLLQIRFCQPHPEAMVPLLDTPISTDRWPELIVAPDGRARLFVQTVSEQADWDRMVGLLHEHWTATLARFGNRLYDFLSDASAVEAYATRKYEILEEFYLTEDLTVDLS